MPHPRFSNKEIVRRGQELYPRDLRAQLEDQCDGKIVVIDVETGDHEIDDDALKASHRVLVKHPGAASYALRVGYDAVYGFGGGPRRVNRHETARR